MPVLLSRLVAVPVALTLILCAVITSVRAADIRVVDARRFDDQHNGSIDVDSGVGNNLRNDADIICNVELRGPIVAGDLSGLKSAIAKIREMQPYATPRLCLESPGGSYGEGLAIAQYLMEEAIGTAVARDAECYSACSLIFMGGSYPWKGQINRFLHVEGVVGFHAPYIASLPDKPYTEGDVRVAFDEGVNAITALMRLGVGNDIRRFPPELMQEMLRQGPNELFAIDTIGKAIRYRVHLYGIEMPAVVSEATLCNACVNMKYGAVEDYGRGASTDLCASPGTTVRKPYPNGTRLIFEVAPRGGTCVMDIAQAGVGITGWMYQPDDDSEWWDGLELAHWFLLPPNTRLAGLSGRSSEPSRSPPPAAAPPGETTMDRDELVRRIVSFVGVDYLGHGLVDHENREDLYAQHVVYFDKGTIARSAVMADKRSYYRKWPRRKYEIVRDSLSANDGPSNSVDITFRYHFEVSDGRRTITGTGMTTLGLIREKDRLLIVRETGRVLERRTSR